MEKDNVKLNAKIHSILSLEELEERLEMGCWLDSDPPHCTVECKPQCGECTTLCSVECSPQCGYNCDLQCSAECIADCPSHCGPYIPNEKLNVVAPKY